jgi:hypothetical protein
MLNQYVKPSAAGRLNMLLTIIQTIRFDMSSLIQYVGVDKLMSIIIHLLSIYVYTSWYSVGNQ